MYKRHTIGGESWSLCHYYYTHNNGSSDDILLKQYKPLKIQKRRNSYPLLRQQQHRQQLREEVEDDDIFFPKRRNNSIVKKKRRETLANILSNMSKKDDETLDKKWQSIDMQMSSLRTNTTLCEINDTTIDIESFESDESVESIQSVNAPLKQASPQRVDSPLPTINQQEQGGEKEEKDPIDMWLFLFGFLCFPLWWISAWRFFTFKKGKRNSRARVFQIVNLWMTMGSLLLLGLMVGLTITFTSRNGS